MKIALLIIDMLEEFVHGKLSSPESRKIIPVIKELIKVARENKIPIIYLADKHFHFDHELKIWGPHAMAESPESEIIDELKPEDKDIVLYKRSYSGFRETGLDYILRDLNIDTLVLTGIHTHICVFHTAIDAYYARYDVIIVEDGVSALSNEDHEWALKYMKEILGCKVMKANEVQKLLEK
nr:isochorismatase family cysteine hydrolase [Methanothermus fervidus]